MAIINLLLWIITYGFCLVHIVLFTIIYFKHKNKNELLFLVVLLNLLFITVVIMLVTLLNQPYTYFVMLNCMLTLYITLTLFIYNLFNVKAGCYKLIPISVGLQVIIDNSLTLLGHYIFVYISRIVFCFLLLIPVFTKQYNTNKDKIENNFRNMSLKTIVIFLVSAIMLIPFGLFLFKIPYVLSFYGAVFTIIYQVPGLIYSIRRLLKLNSTSDKSGLTSLTKRENEVALLIFQSYKYEEIARKLFVSLSAVKKHSYNIYRKLGINNNRELIHIIMEEKNNNGN